MKKNKVIVLTICIALGFFFIFSNWVVRADSGWDYDYDGGYDVGDYDSGSSYDSSGSYSSSNGSFSTGGATLPISIGATIVVMIVALVMNKKKKGPVHSFIPDDNNAVEDEIIERGMIREQSETIEILDNNYDSVIQKYLPDYTEEKLLKELYTVFVTVQKAWTDFDYATLEKNCSKLLFESYRSDLEVLKDSHGKNITKDFEKISSNIRNIEEKNNKVYVEMYLFVSFYDYVINTLDECVIRGNMDSPVRNSYDLEFVLDLEGTTTCPSCGAPLTSDECDSCHTLMEKKRESFVLNKKGIMRN